MWKCEDHNEEDQSCKKKPQEVETCADCDSEETDCLLQGLISASECRIQKTPLNQFSCWTNHKSVSALQQTVLKEAERFDANIIVRLFLFCFVSSPVSRDQDRKSVKMLKMTLIIIKAPGF